MPRIRKTYYINGHPPMYCEEMEESESIDFLEVQ